MNKYIWMIVAVFSMAICTMSVVLGQDKQHAAGLGPNIAPMSSTEKAKQKESYQLDQAAQAAMDANRYAEAEKYARQSISIGIYSGVNQEILAAALDAQGKTHEALLAYKAISDEGGNFSRNALPYALLLLKTDDWADAVEAFNKQLPYMADGEIMRDTTDFSVDNPQPRELEAAIHTGLGLEYDWRGYNWKLHGREQTLVQFRKALALEPRSPVVNYYYGFGLRDAGHTAEAKAAFQKAADLSKGDMKSAAVKQLKL